MSAYFVSANTLNCILSCAKRHNRFLVDLVEHMPELALSDEELTRVGRMLWRENEKSLRYRYADAGDQDSWGPDFAAIDDFVFQERQDSDWQAIMSCNNYDYQSCEHPEWEASKAKAFNDAVRDACLKALRIDRDGFYDRPEAQRLNWSL